MSRLSDLRLTLFFTSGLSLRDWEEAGILQREIRLYQALRPHLRGITLVTYGDRRDLELTPKLDGLHLVCNRWGLSPAWYLRYLRFTPEPWRRAAGIYKSNQVEGSETALRLARRAGKPCIARCGYLASEFAARRHGPDSAEARRAAAVEWESFHGADRVMVTTQAMSAKIQSDYRIPAAKIRVTPNYVDMERFKPAPDAVRATPPRLLFVGRLDDQKNLPALLTAAAGLEISLWLVGDGPRRAELEAAAPDNVRFLGRLPQEALPGLFAEASAFVLPSLYEGHPKALLEAMAAGLPVIGARAPGIREAIRHGETGLLCGHRADEIRAAISTLLDHPELARRLGEAGRAAVLEENALPRVAARELACLEELAADGFSPPKTG